MDKTKFTVQNQTNIFNAVSSLMKAESYEMSSLERRKKDGAIYNFNLISIVDSELVKVHCKGKKTIATEVEETKAIFNYIVNKKETASRIHFFTFNAIEKSLRCYDQLHELNKSFITTQINEFYKDILTDWRRISVVVDDFNNGILAQVNYYCNYESGYQVEFKNLDLSLSKDGLLLKIGLYDSEEVLDFLNNHKELNKATKEKLKKVFNYIGNFIFVEDEIPF